MHGTDPTDGAHTSGRGADRSRVNRQTYDIRLTPAEAVVLFALLHRVSESDLLVLDTAERAVTANLQELLEGALTERIDLGYADTVARAKSRLTGCNR